MNFLRTFMLVMTITLVFISAHSEFIEITGLFNAPQRSLFVTSIAVNNDPCNQMIVLYSNTHKATIFRLNLTTNNPVNITIHCGIPDINLCGIQSINFLSNQLMIICYGNSDKLAKLYSLNESGTFIDVTADCGICLKDLEKAQVFIHFDSAINRDSLTVLICYSSPSGKLPKLFKYDQNENIFTAIHEIEVPFFKGIKNIDYDENQMIVAYLKSPAKVLEFCEETKSFFDVSSSCGIKIEDLENVQSATFSNGQLVVTYSSYGDHRIGKRRQPRSLYDGLRPMNNKINYEKDYKSASLYQINPNDFGGTYIPSDYIFNNQVLQGAACIKFIRASEGVIALISYASGELRTFLDRDAIFYEKKPMIKSSIG